MTMTKTIGYLVMLGAVILFVIALALIIHNSVGIAILIALAVVFFVVGYYIAKKQPSLPGVH